MSDVKVLISLSVIAMSVSAYSMLISMDAFCPLKTKTFIIFHLLKCHIAKFKEGG